jgi:hypothetical protein
MFPAIKSDLITGPVIVGVRHNLPFEGVSLLLGNNLAGIKVVAEHIVKQKCSLIKATHLPTTKTEKRQCPVKSE